MVSLGPLESGHPSAVVLGRESALDDVGIILDAHFAVLPTIQSRSTSIAEAIDLIVGALSQGARLLYLGAGTSGWLAALDAAEVVVTFGMAGRVESIIGGGRLLDPMSLTLGDDDVDAVATDEVILGCQPGDVVVAVSASGRTPFTLAAAERLRTAGAAVVALVNDQDSPLAKLADVTVCVPIDGEVVAGSTRLTAGMAQKITLNTLSTASMVRLGRVVNGQMVCVEPLNDKLRKRVVSALATAVDVDVPAAMAALDVAGRGDAAAVMLLAGIDAEEAKRRLDRCFGNIQAAVLASTDRA